MQVPIISNVSNERGEGGIAMSSALSVGWPAACCSKERQWHYRDGLRKCQSFQSGGPEIVIACC